MPAHSGDIMDIASACPQVGLIRAERLFDDQQLRGRGASLSADDRSRLFLRLPVIEDGRAIGIVEVVGVADSLCPFRAAHIGDTGNPRSCGAVAAIAEPDAETNLYE